MPFASHSTRPNVYDRRLAGYCTRAMHANPLVMRENPVSPEEENAKSSARREERKEKEPRSSRRVCWVLGLDWFRGLPCEICTSGLWSQVQGISSMIWKIKYRTELDAIVEEYTVAPKQGTVPGHFLSTAREARGFIIERHHNHPSRHQDLDRPRESSP